GGDTAAAGGEAVESADDVASWAGARRTVELAYETWGRLDVLVNNAGVLRDRMSFNMSEEEFDLVLRVHCKGHFAMIHHACTRWRERAKRGEAVGGRIINTASEAGLIGPGRNSNYANAETGVRAARSPIAPANG